MNINNHERKGLSVTRTNQKGFTLIEGLLITIALTLIVGVGYYILNANNKDTTASKNTAERIIPKKKSSPDQKKYLAIKEAGIKIELTEDIADAYYAVSSDGYIYFSTHYFDNLQGFEACRAIGGGSITGINALASAKVGDDNYGSPWTKEQLEGFPNKLIDNTYYWIQKGNGAPCWYTNDDNENTRLGNSAGVQKLADIQRAFYEQIGTITKL